MNVTSRPGFPPRAFQAGYSRLRPFYGKLPLEIGHEAQEPENELASGRRKIEPLGKAVEAGFLLVDGVDPAIQFADIPGDPIKPPDNKRVVWPQGLNGEVQGSGAFCSLPKLSQRRHPPEELPQPPKLTIEGQASGLL